MDRGTGTGVGSFTTDNGASVEHAQHNIGVQSNLGRLKRKYHEIRTENSQLKKVTETVQSSAGSSETLRVDPMTSSSSTSNALHGGATFDGETTASSKFNGKLVESFFIIEVCAGTARLSRTAQNMVFKVMAIDHSSKRSCGMPIQCFELEDPTQVAALADFISTEHNNIAYIWFAPSCGTASRARERKQARLERMGHVLPGPLRSELQPDQMDGLSGTDKLKTEKANLLYDAIYTLAVACHNNDVAFAIENPGNSHFWNTSPIKQLQQEVTHHLVSFHNCCHGGERDKLTSILVNNDWLDGLEGATDDTNTNHGRQRSKTTRFILRLEKRQLILGCFVNELFTPLGLLSNNKVQFITKPWSNSFLISINLQRKDWFLGLFLGE